MIIKLILMTLEFDSAVILLRETTCRNWSLLEVLNKRIRGVSHKIVKSKRLFAQRVSSPS